MTRFHRALLGAAAIILIIGVAWPGAVWAQKRPAPDNGKVSGKAVERSQGPSEHGKARAGDKGKGAGAHAEARPVEEHAGARHGDGHEIVRVEDRWWDRDRNYVVVHDYYGRHGLPPGLARKHKLPPGLQKQLRERGHLPPGIEKHWVVLPVEMERTLPPLPPHYVRRCVGDDLLVIDVRTNFVVSIMAGVFIGG